MKKILILLLFVWFSVPFVLMTDLYPFFRFGMFAEPLKPTQTTEMLQLWWKNAEGEVQRFQPDVIGLSENHFGYVLRHYFYTHKTKQLFSQIYLKVSKKSKPLPIYWQIRRLQVNSKQLKTSVLQEHKAIE